MRTQTRAQIKYFINILYSRLNGRLGGNRVPYFTASEF